VFIRGIAPPSAAARRLFRLRVGRRCPRLVSLYNSALVPNYPDGSRPRSREELWDQFVDELDRQGQAGSAADVIIPDTLHPEAPSGKPFGQLTRIDIGTLAEIGSRLGRRGDVIKDIWQRTQKKLKAKARPTPRRG
jgi:hypothetical protein